MPAFPATDLRAGGRYRVACTFHLHLISDFTGSLPAGGIPADPGMHFDLGPVPADDAHSAIRSGVHTYGLRAGTKGGNAHRANMVAIIPIISLAARQPF